MEESVLETDGNRLTFRRWPRQAGAPDYAHVPDVLVLLTTPCLEPPHIAGIAVVEIETGAASQLELRTLLNLLGLVGPALLADSASRVTAAALARAHPELIAGGEPIILDVDFSDAAALGVAVMRSCLVAGFKQVEVMAASLAGDFASPAPEPGWSRRDLLAHVSSSQAALPAVLIAPPSGGAGADGRPFDPDRWNRTQLQRRAEATPHDLVAELAETNARLLPMLSSLDTESTINVGPHAGEKAGLTMIAMLHHQLEHLQELRT